MLNASEDLKRRFFRGLVMAMSPEEVTAWAIPETYHRHNRKEVYGIRTKNATDSEGGSPTGGTD